MTETANNVRDIVIQGTEFQLEVPYAAEHILTAAEASQLNQVYIENISNNFRAKVKEMLEAGATVEAIQAELDKYADEYEFGSRRSSSGVRRSADPVMKEMRLLAKKALTDFFKKKDVQFNDLSSDEKEQAIKAYFEKHGDKVRAIAERRIADATAMAEVGV